jgi:hypothetical protein
MVNHLANETSPYLQQHKHNPVDWYPWNETALARAKEEQKPIFLSIGYAACHWCHVMAHESFENPHTAQILNDHFISIKVDREERPDLDEIYMHSVVMLTGQGGWPLSVFLTPDLEPFYGGTYFPPIPRHGLPSFNQVLSSVIDTWNNNPDAIRNNARILTDEIAKQHSQLAQSDQPPDLTAIVNRLHRAYDWQTGGWGRAPKFPQPMLIEFLILSAQTGNAKAKELVTHILAQMAQGGMYDLVGGGFHRYSTDAHWLIPHFEKMLYDNAQLALAYLHGYALTGEPRFLEVTHATLAFMQREMTHPQGGFYASMDADTPEGEGRYYAWQVDELKEVLTQEQFDLLQELTNITTQGNFEEDLNVLQLKDTVNAASPEQRAQLKDIFNKLRIVRDRRVQPGKDEKIITEWNAMAIRAFAEAGLLLGRTDYMQTAKKGLDFILENLRTPDGRLYRTWRDGKASQPGTLADYGALIAGLHAVYIIDFDPALFQQMRSLFTYLQADFAADGGLYYDSAAHVPNLVVRPRSLQDNATPSGNAQAVFAHWLIANYEHQPDHLDLINRMLLGVSKSMQDYPTSFGYWLQVAGLLTYNTRQIALISQADLNSLAPFLEIYRSKYRPFDLIAARVGELNTQTAPPALLNDRSTIHGEPTAYVCHGFVCQAPTTNPEVFRQQLQVV